MRSPNAPPVLRRPSRRQPGITLLEVLIALAVVGTALGAGLRAIGSMAQHGEALRDTMMATWSAENRLVQARLAGEWPAVGERSYSCTQGYLELLCTERVFATPNPNFRRVEVSVARTATPERRILKLNQVTPHETN